MLDVRSKGIGNASWEKCSGLLENMDEAVKSRDSQRRNWKGKTEMVTVTAAMWREMGENQESISTMPEGEEHIGAAGSYTAPEAVQKTQ